MKRKPGKFLWVVMMLSLLPVFAQEQPQSEETDQNKFLNASLGTYKSLSHFELQDHKWASEIDSLWLKEMLNSNLYPRLMEHNVLEIPYDTDNISAADYQELPIKVLKKRLKELDAKTPFKVTYNPELEKMIRFYLSQRKEWVENMMTLSLYYFPMFEEELAKHNLPLELKYLAVIESGLNPRIKSRAGATGLWQFMFSSAKMQGLTISNYVDERMDPQKSTVAAVDYLSKLFDLFKDWDMALAAYNSGPGNVSKAIRRSGGETDYWRLKRYLPRETANYVPSFLAAMYLFNYANEHGFAPYKPDILSFETDTIKVRQAVTFDQIHQATGVSKEVLSFLNPAYKLDIVPYIEGKDYAVRLPLSDVGLFVANEADIYRYVEAENKAKTKELPKYTEDQSSMRYRVQKGDYLGKIAKRYGVSVSSIKKWNNMRSDALRAGQLLTIYPRR